MKNYLQFITGLPVYLIIILLASSGLIFSQSGNIKHGGKNNNMKKKDAAGAEFGNGAPSVFLSKAEQINSGITALKLVKTLHRAQSVAYGYVVPVKDLSGDLQNYASAKSQLAKSREDLSVSETNYDRERSLYENKLASNQDYLASKAAYLSDKADVDAAQSNLTSIKSRIIEQWGNKISGWIFNGSADLNSLMSLKTALIQISLLPENKGTEIPRNIKVIPPFDGGKPIDCKYVSAGHLANSQFQTITFYYIASSPSLNGGMNLKAFLPTGKESAGVIVPSSSIVWYKGVPWIYVETSGNNFTRTEIETVNPVKSGFFVPEEKVFLKPGVKAVTRGAQLLLSKELMPAQKQAGGDEEDND